MYLFSNNLLLSGKVINSKSDLNVSWLVKAAFEFLYFSTDSSGIPWRWLKYAAVVGGEVLSAVSRI